jgi:hypothetical protein
VGQTPDARRRGSAGNSRVVAKIAGSNGPHAFEEYSRILLANSKVPKFEYSICLLDTTWEGSCYTPNVHGNSVHQSTSSW